MPGDFWSRYFEFWLIKPPRVKHVKFIKVLSLISLTNRKKKNELIPIEIKVRLPLNFSTVIRPHGGNVLIKLSIQVARQIISI